MDRKELEKLLICEDDYSQYKLFVWGTGNTASLYQEGLSRLSDMNIVGYADNNTDKWGKTFGGKPVYSPEQIMEVKDALVLIASPQPHIYEAIHNQLDDCGIVNMHIDKYIFTMHKDEVLACYDLMEDDYSKELYAHLIQCRIMVRYPDNKYVDRDFCSIVGFFSDCNENEVYVDCGAYVGDTIEKYIWKKEGVFKRIIAFEPDADNLIAMSHRLERLKREWNIPDKKIEVYPYGVSDKSTVLFVDRYEQTNGYGTKISTMKADNSKECKMVSIDEAICGSIGFIKADIESYEYRLLLGAEETIKTYSPKLAICIYHSAIDFFQIPLLLQKMNPNYCFSLRHYSSVLSETIVFAYL